MLEHSYDISLEPPTVTYVTLERLGFAIEIPKNKS